MARWTPEAGRRLGRMLGLLAVLACCAPAAASAYTTTSDRYGGDDRTINTYDEVRALLTDPAFTESMLSDMSSAEQSYVIDNGLTADSFEVGRDPDDAQTPPPTGTVSTSEGAMAPTACNYRDPDCDTRTGLTRYPSRTGTFWCNERSRVNVLLWQLYSRWNWSWDGTRVRTAAHAEWVSIRAAFWHSDGTTWLLKTGAVGTWYVGREVQGKAHFTFGIIHSARDRIISPKVYGNGTATATCRG